jgi:hypothetical protein
VAIHGFWIAASLTLLSMNSPVIVKVAVIANVVKQSMTSDCMDRHGLQPRGDGAGSRSVCGIGPDSGGSQ